MKAIFDSTHDHYQFIVTGSAKLNIFKKAGDSLAGRYFMFQLNPLGLWELSSSTSDPSTPQENAGDFLKTQMNKTQTTESTLESLLELSGFPEPYLSQSKAFYETWTRDYMDTVVKEDIGTLTRIMDKEHLHDVYRLLPEMVGSPLSESSIASHLELSNPTIKNYLRRLEDFYLAFKVHPYSKNIKRALLKAPKCYLYDWSRIENPGFRFENFVAVQLMAHLRLWQEQSGIEYALYYVRNKQKQESDFLVLKKRKPWLLFEAKLSDGTIENHHFDFQKQLGDIPLVQVCRQPGIAQMQTKNSFRISATRLFAG